MQEPADAEGRHPRLEERRDEHQMVVVHPDRVALLHHLEQLGGEGLVGAHVGAPLGLKGRRIEHVHYVVEERPEDGVAEAVVVLIGRLLI